MYTLKNFFNLLHNPMETHQAFAQEDIVRYSKAEVGRGRTQHISMPHMLPSDVERRLETLIPSRLRR